MGVSCGTTATEGAVIYLDFFFVADYPEPESDANKSSEGLTFLISGKLTERLEMFTVQKVSHTHMQSSLDCL